MADKQVIIEFKVEGSEALNMTVALTDKLNELKAQKKELEKALKEDGGNKALKEQLAQVNAQIGSTNTSLRGYQNELKNMVKAGEAERNSLNQQRATLAALTSQWDRLSEAERNSAQGQELFNKINNVKDSVSELEQSTGRFGRNVGNYKQAILGAADALKGIGGGASVAINGVKAFGASLKALVANPWAALIGVIVGAFVKLRDAIRNNDEASTAWAELMATLKPIINVVKSAMEALANVLTKVFRNIADFNQRILSHIPLLGKWAESNRKLVKSQDELEESERRTSTAIAQFETKAAEAMEIATDSENESYAKRKEAIEEWWETKKNIYEADLKLKEASFKQLVLETAAEHGLVQGKNEDWEAYKDVVRAAYDTFSDKEKNALETQQQTIAALKTGLAEAERTYNKTKKRINNEEANEAAARKKDQQEVNDALLVINATAHEIQIKEVNKYYDELVRKAHGNKKQIVEIEKQRAIAIAKVYADTLDAEMKKYTDGLAVALSNAKKSFEDFQKTSNSWEKIAEIAEKNDESLQLLEAKNNKERLLLAAQFTKKRLEIAQEMYSTMSKMEGESDVDFELRRQNQLKSLIEYKNQYNSIAQQIAQSNIDLTKQQLDVIGQFTDATKTMADSIIDALSKSAEDEEKYQKWKLIMSIIEAQIQGGLAIMSAISVATPGDPYSVAARIASAAAAAGAATIAAVAQLTSLKGGIPNAPKFAQGGYVSGKGTATSDDIMAWLSNGESVMTARTTKMFAPMLSAMNVAGGGAPITQAEQNNTMRNMWESAFSEMPAPVVSVKEVTNVANRVRIKENISSN